MNNDDYLDRLERTTREKREMAKESAGVTLSIKIQMKKDGRIMPIARFGRSYNEALTRLAEAAYDLVEMGKIVRVLSGIHEGNLTAARADHQHGKAW